MMKVLCSILFLSLISTGMAQNRCSPSEIQVSQQRTGALVQGKSEFRVTLFNSCRCTVGGVQLDCNGFQTAEKIPPNVLVVSGGRCRLPQGTSIAPSDNYVFNYAGDSEFQFETVAGACV